MMKFTDSKDKEKRKELHKLYVAWEKVIERKPKICSPKDGKDYDPIRYFNLDGFYPGYFSTRPRILFIGRESRSFSNNNDIPIDTIKNDDPKDWLRYVFYKRILYLVYGIKEKGKYQFKDIRIDQVLEKMKKNNNFSFAFINISKYSNDGNYQANYKLINRFLEDSELEKRNFIREEIELLDPDIIITANLWNGKIRKKRLDLIFPEEDMTVPLLDNNKIPNANKRIFILNGKEIKLLDTYHFSAYRRKNWETGKMEYVDDQKHFYDPVMNLLFRQ